MRRSRLFKAVAVVPIAGIALFAGRAGAADPPPNPPKDVAPKEVAPKEAAPKEVEPKDVAPKEVAPKDTTPQPSVSGDPRQVPSRDATKDPRDTARDPRDATKDPRDAVKGPRETTRDPGTTVRDSRDATGDPRGATRDPSPNARDAKSGTTARDTRRENRRTDRDLGLTFGRVTDRGLTVSDLGASSQLYKSGLRRGDYIVSVNGHRLQRADDFDRWVYDGDTNERIKAIVWRNGGEEVVYFEPTVFYADESYDADFVYFGVVFDDRNPDRLIIRRVYPESPAFAAGLREGDEITTWHGERITSPRDFGRTIHRIDAGTMDFEYMRDSKPVRAEARFNHRVATKTSTGNAAPAPEERDSDRNLPPPPATAPAVTPNPSTAPAPPAVTPPAPRRPGLIRDR